MRAAIPVVLFSVRCESLLVVVRPPLPIVRLAASFVLSCQFFDVERTPVGPLRRLAVVDLCLRTRNADLRSAGGSSAVPTPERTVLFDSTDLATVAHRDLGVDSSQGLCILSSR